MLRRRSRTLLVLALLAFLGLVYAYAQIEWKMPQGFAPMPVSERGRILASDGSVLAETVGTERLYPQGSLAGQLVGVMGRDRGLEGAEHFFDSMLARGEDVRLTIDPAVQAVAESVLAEGVQREQGQYGSVVAMDVRTGRVLAAATYPPYDPTDGTRSYNTYTWRNRPLADAFEPGSVVKALTVAALLNDGVTTPNTEYSTPMVRRVGGRAIHDAVYHPPRLTTKGILRYSSNVGISHLVENYPARKLHAYMRAYGFGQVPDLRGFDTTPGVLPSWDKWSQHLKTVIAFGQGMSVSLVQLAAAYNVLANDGVYIPPVLLEGVPRAQPREVIRPEVAKATRTLLQAVVEEGIPHQAGLPGYTVGGKTGTAQVVVGNRYSDTIYNSVFAGFYPVDKPRMTVVVMVHGAQRRHHGSQLAAPIFRDIASEVFSSWALPPLLEDKDTKQP
ncbi:cell division protein FtsI (penicillin-binding protein 3) [Deinobacterium chartae]|uniref:Cell division protein FtsI (Penicillin-binding protein 3) n=1 Tax=Deinobacterium chartae TaxID=521158 RepID=A0A841HYM1_9DEIO|nr:penicillin-binding protein 2 [Deinobacterium chartae]MBB6097002.1 cell division protein FtsI (penicillin-binding protein 3) [Deinobacterium chartae]